MNQTHSGVKVGLFVALGLLLLAGLLFNFSKGISVFTPTYTVYLKASSIGGLKKNANVLLSGVPVGKVTGYDLTPDGRAVLIHLELEKRYQERIHADAQFRIEQLGLLGDQYVEIAPRQNKAPPLQPGQTVTAEQPVSFQETARSAKDLMQLASQTLTSINEVLERANRTVLNDRTLTNVAGTLDKIREISDHAASTVGRVDSLLQTNSPAIGSAITNLLRFAGDMEKLSTGLNQLVATNSVGVNKAVTNLEGMSQSLKQVANDLQAGQGVAGMLLKDEVFRERISNVASNLQLFSRNLNEHGLLHNLFFKPKPTKKKENKERDPAPETR